MIPDRAFEALERKLESFEQELGVPVGFLGRLFQDDDWSFVIKAHALIEAAVSHQLASVLDPRLRPVFDLLALSESRVGKIAFAEALELLNEDHRRFIRKLSEVRNRLVHDVRQVDVDLDSYARGLDANQRRSLFKALTCLTPPQGVGGYSEMTGDRLKFELWLGLIRVLSTVVTATTQAKVQRELQRISTEPPRVLKERPRAPRERGE